MEQNGELLDQKVLLTESKIALDSAWLADIRDDKERDEFRQMLVNSGQQFGKLRTIIEDMYREAQVKAERGVTDSPNWSELVAYQMGYQRALRDVYSRIPKTTKE